MTQEPKTRLFAVTITAARTRDDGTPEVGLQNIVGLLVGDTDILEAWKEHARAVYPDTDKWRDHQAVWTEIDQGMMFGPLRLTWQVEDTSNGAGQ